MRLKPSSFTPEAGAYAGLQAAPLAEFAGHAAGRRPRGLSEKQQQNRLLGQTAFRVAEEARDRKRRYLRRLDKIHASGCRTKQQRWDALATLIGPMLARVDVATLVLGWLDADGQFRLNRQRGLAEDTGLTESRVSRTLSALEAAGYVRRKLRRIYQHGQRWITRVMIHLRPRFFTDLGLGYQLATERTAKKKRRDKALAGTKARQQTERLNELARAQQKRQSHAKAQGVRRAKVVKLQDARDLDMQRVKAEAFHQLAIEHPDLSPGQLRELLDSLMPNSP